MTRGSSPKLQTLAIAGGSTRAASLFWLWSDTTLSLPGDNHQRVISDGNSVRITSYVLLVDEDIGDGRLVSLLSEVILDFAPIGAEVKPECWVSLGRYHEGKGDALLDVNLVLQVGEVGIEYLLGPLAVWAVGLGEDDDFVAGDGFFNKGSLSRHDRGGGWGAGEERANGAVIYTGEHSRPRLRKPHEVCQ